MKLAFLGLGVMGFPMAGHWAKAGHEVTVFNRTAAKADGWAKAYAGKPAATVAEAVRGAQIVAMCVGADDDVRAVGGQAVAAMERGAILIDHTTASALVAREMGARAAEAGLGFIDAPVSGGQAGAENGALTVMCGGDPATFDKARPVMEVYGRAVKLMGPTGSGQITKMINQVCIAGAVQGMAEGLHFAKCAGLDPEAVLEAISKGAAQSWQMDNRWSTAARGEFDFGFATDWMRKDLGLVLDEARRNGAHMSLTALVDQFYGEVQSMGGGRWDSSSLAARLEDRRK
jgi:3-hydroxyisobutyrate dehydrogenase